MILKRSDILSRKDLPTRTVAVPEWGGEVIVRTLTAGERDDFEIGVRQAREEDEDPKIRATLVSLACVDEEGNRLFRIGDVDELAALSSKAVDRIFGVAQQLAGMTPDDVEAISKNSGNGQPASSS